MPDHTDSRHPSDWQLALSRSPVFWFELRRLWRVSTVVGMLFAFAAIGALGWMTSPGGTAVRLPGAAARKWRPPRILRPALPPSPPIATRRTSTPPLYRDAWRYTLPYRLMQWLAWTLTVAARYILPVIAATSLVGDRTAGRLEPMLATLLTPRAVFIGRLGGVVGPLFLPAMLAAPALALWSQACRAPGSLVAAQTVDLGAGVLLGATVGLWMGASVRPPALAIAAAVITTGFVMPPVLYFMGALAGHLLDSFVLDIVWRQPIRGVDWGTVNLTLWTVGSALLQLAMLAVLSRDTTRLLVRPVE